MTPQNSPNNNPSADLEKAALSRFRALVLCLPQTCKVFRELRDHSTIVCLDFAECPGVDQSSNGSILAFAVSSPLSRIS